MARRAFTVVELVVVIAIVSIVMALTLASIQRVREAAARTRCQNQLKQIGLALHSYHGAHHSLPPGVSYHDGSDPNPFMSWLTRLLPYVEQESQCQRAQQAFAQDRNFLHDPPHTGLSTKISGYVCPSDGRTERVNTITKRTFAFTSYLGVEGRNQFSQDGVLYLDSKIRFSDVRDGTSSTQMIGERPSSADGVLGWWYAGWGQSKDGSADMVLGVREKNAGTFGAGCPAGPYHFKAGRVTNQCDAFHYWSLHPGGANFAFADGSVRFLSYSADPIMPALATRAGGEVVELP
jgi:prepilin-type processing-associated H-X9-DG protein/prepilin-type N-terminal cleavage/methylation domain-containing protein